MAIAGGRQPPAERDRLSEPQTQAIVLTVRDYGEADLLVTFLTPGRGRLTGIAKHARKSRRRFAHCLEPLSRVVFFLSTRSPRGSGVLAEKVSYCGRFPCCAGICRGWGRPRCWPRWRGCWPGPRRPSAKSLPPWKQP